MTLSELSSSGLWHELTLALESQLSTTESQSERVGLYRKFAAGHLTQLNPLKAVELTRQLLRSGTDDGGVVLEILNEKFPENLEISNAAEFQVMCLRAECGLRVEGASETVRRILAKLEDTEQTNWKSLSEFSRVSVLFAKMIGNLSSLYFHGVRYLATTPSDQLALAESGWLAKDAALAGLLSPEIFDLGGILAEAEKLKALLGAGEAEKLLSLLRAFDGGDIRKFDAAVSGVGVFTGEQVGVLKEKIQIMALLEICSNVKAVGFSAVAAHVGLGQNEVERLVLRALGGGLLRGGIDEVNHVVRVDWVRPRILDANRIGNLKSLFDQWKSQLELNFSSEA